MGRKRTSDKGMTAIEGRELQKGKDGSAALRVEKPHIPCSKARLDVGVDLAVGLQQYEASEEKGEMEPVHEKALYGEDTAEDDECHHDDDNGTHQGDEKRVEGKAKGGSRGEREENSSLLRIEQKMRAMVRMRKRKAKKCVERLQLLQQPSQHRQQHQQLKTYSSEEDGNLSVLNSGGDKTSGMSETRLRTGRFSCIPSGASNDSPSPVMCASRLPKDASYAELSVSPASSASVHLSDCPYSRSPHQGCSIPHSPSSGSALSTRLGSYPSSPSCSPVSSSAPHALAVAPASCLSSSLRMSCCSSISDPLQACSPGQRLRELLSPSRRSLVAAAVPSFDSRCTDGRTPSLSSELPCASCSPSHLPQSVCVSTYPSHSFAFTTIALCLRPCRCRTGQLSIRAAARFFGAVCTWYAASLLLTALNKYLFDVLDLPLPVSVTFLHFSFVSIALQILVCIFPHLLPSALPSIQPIALSILPAAACAAADVALTNSSYSLLPISAITLVKSSSVFFTYLFSVLCLQIYVRAQDASSTQQEVYHHLGHLSLVNIVSLFLSCWAHASVFAFETTCLEAFRMETLATLIFIMVSICLTVPEMEMKNPIGVVVISIAVFVGALRWIFIQRTLRQHQGLSVPHLLLWLQPISSICLSPAVVFYELPPLLSGKIPDGGVAVTSSECQQFLAATLIAAGSIFTAALVLFAEVSLLESLAPSLKPPRAYYAESGIHRLRVTVVFGEVLPARVLLGIVASIIGVLYYAYIRYRLTSDGPQQE